MKKSAGSRFLAEKCWEMKQQDISNEAVHQGVRAVVRNGEGVGKIRQHRYPTAT